MITTQAELEAVRAQCRRLVRNRSLISAGVAVVPVPALDVLTDLGLMRQMLPEISRRFGLDAAQVAALDPQRAQRVMAVANRVGSAVIGRVVTERLVASLLRRLVNGISTTASRPRGSRCCHRHSRHSPRSGDRATDCGRWCPRPESNRHIHKDEGF
jgi:uncharacterized protein (DUF697 family)